MQVHGMAGGPVQAEDERPFVAHDVEHSAVLDVGARADADVVHVAANHRAWPHTRVLANDHVADDNGTGADISRFRDLWPLAARRSNHAIPLICPHKTSTARRAPARKASCLDMAR